MTLQGTFREVVPPERVVDYLALVGDTSVSSLVGLENRISGGGPIAGTRTTGSAWASAGGRASRMAVAST